jgi:hypothetical protein
MIIPSSKIQGSTSLCCDQVTNVSLENNLYLLFKIVQYLKQNFEVAV